jgi:hypothetical protein
MFVLPTLKRRRKAPLWVSGAVHVRFGTHFRFETIPENNSINWQPDRGLRELSSRDIEDSGTDHFTWQPLIDLFALRSPG